MAAKTDGLLIHRDLIRKDRRLGKDAARVELCVLKHLSHFGFQPCPIIRHNARGTFLHLACEGFNGFGTVKDVLGKPPAFSFPHHVKIGQSLIHGLQQKRFHCLRLLFLFFYGKNVGKAGQVGGIIRVLCPAPAHMDKLLQRVHICLRQRLVYSDGHIVSGNMADIDKNIYLTAAYFALDTLFQSLLGK